MQFVGPSVTIEACTIVPNDVKPENLDSPPMNSKPSSEIACMATRPSCRVGDVAHTLFASSKNLREPLLPDLVPSKFDVLMGFPGDKIHTDKHAFL